MLEDDGDESESAATGRISVGWQVAPILRTGGCDGCNENAVRGRSSHVVASLGTTSRLVFMGNSWEGCFVREIGNHPPRTWTEGSSATFNEIKKDQYS